MTENPPIPTLEQLHEAKFLEDQLQNLINLAATQETRAPPIAKKWSNSFAITGACIPN